MMCQSEGHLGAEPVMVSDSSNLRPPSILIATETFPNRFQPYLVNSIEQAIRRGAEVTIVTGGRLGQSYPKRVDDLSLLARTHYFRFESASNVLRQLRTYLPFNHQGLKAYQGLCRLLKSPSRGPTSFRAWVKAIIQAPLLGRPNFDLVHAHYLSGAYEYLFVAMVLEIPLVTTFYGLPTRGGSAELSPDKTARVFECGKLFLVCTRFAQHQLEARGCPPEKIRILPQGLWLEDFSYRPKPYPLQSPVVLLTVARLSVEKGHRHALEGVSRLRQMGRSVEYRIVGSGYERENLQNLVRELRLSDCVHFMGSVDDTELRKHYEQAHILILPSVTDCDGYHTETQGVVIQEAQASGLIVVASRTGGIPECVDDGRSAFLVPEGDPEALAQTIAWIMDHPEQWGVWQREGRAWVEQHFDMTKIGRRLWDIYTELLDAHCRRNRIRSNSQDLARSE